MCIRPALYLNVRDSARLYDLVLAGNTYWLHQDTLSRMWLHCPCMVKVGQERRGTIAKVGKKLGITDHRSALIIISGEIKDEDSTSEICYCFLFDKRTVRNLHGASVVHWFFYILSVTVSAMGTAAGNSRCKSHTKWHTRSADLLEFENSRISHHIEAVCRGCICAIAGYDREGCLGRDILY